MSLDMKLEEKGQIQRHLERNLMEASENLEEPTGHHTFFSQAILMVL